MSFNTEFLFGSNEKISSSQGERQHPIYQERKNHNGADIAVPEGTNIMVPSDAVVVFAGIQTSNPDVNDYDKDDNRTEAGYGNYIILAHKDNTGDVVFTQYGHLENIPKEIEIGKKFEAGEIFAQTGDTGVSTGPHLHYEERELIDKSIKFDDFVNGERNWSELTHIWHQDGSKNAYKKLVNVLDPAEDNFKFQESHENRQELKEWLLNHKDLEMQELAKIIGDDWLNINSDYIIPSNNAVLTGNQAQNLEDKLRQVSKQWDNLLNDEMKNNTIESAIKEVLGEDNIFNDGISFGISDDSSDTSDNQDNPDSENLNQEDKLAIIKLEKEESLHSLLQLLNGDGKIEKTNELSFTNLKTNLKQVA